MAGTYSLKDIRVTITLDSEGAGNQYEFQGFAISCAISKTGGVDFATAQVEIYGLSLDLMGQLTWLAFKPLNRRYNMIEIAAGEQGGDLPVIFRGCITVAYANLNGSSPVLHIEAQVGAYPLLKPSSPVSVKGTADAATLIQNFATEAGLKFENDGVVATVSDAQIAGDPITKMRAVADQIGADLLLDDEKATLIPRGGLRSSPGGIPVISAESGMIGYPIFTNIGIHCETFFRPDLLVGAAVRVESIVPNASGIWKITQLTHELSAHNPNSAAWKTTFEGMWIEE